MALAGISAAPVKMVEAAVSESRARRIENPSLGCPCHLRASHREVLQGRRNTSSQHKAGRLRGRLINICQQAMLRSSSNDGCSTADGTRRRRPSRAHGPSRVHGPNRARPSHVRRVRSRVHAHLRSSCSWPETHRTSSPCPPHKPPEARLQPIRASRPSERLQFSRSPCSSLPFCFAEAKPFQRSLWRRNPGAGGRD